MSNKTTKQGSSLQDCEFQCTLALWGLWGLAALAIWSLPGIREPQRFRYFMYSGPAAGIPLLILHLRNTNRGDWAKRCRVVLAILLTFGTWGAIVQDGYYGDATALYRWRSWDVMDASHSDDRSESPLDRDEMVLTSSERTDPESSFSDPSWDYAGFLGPHRNATLTAPRLVTDWGARQPVERWRVSVGESWSSFALVSDFAITQEQHGADEAVVCRSLATGAPVWTVVNENVRFGEAYGGYGPRATPTVFDGHVFSLGAAGDLQCIELESGAIVWRTNILEDANVDNIKWGVAGSPLVYDQFVVVCPGGEHRRSVVAYDRMTGRIAWHSSSGKAAYSSPMLVEFGGTQQVVLLNGPGLESFDAKNGTPLWSYPWVVNANMMTSVTQPLAIPTDSETTYRFFVSGGYGKGCCLIEVSKQDETDQGEEGEFARFVVEECWEPNRHLKAKFNTMVHHNGYIFGMDDQILVCLDLKDGRRCWKKGRYGYGQLLLVADTILLQAENGDVVLVRPTSEGHEELARISPLSRKTWNNPALRGNLLVVRNDQEAVCLELPLVAPN